jgi:hypothetical protein
MRQESYPSYEHALGATMEKTAVKASKNNMLFSEVALAEILVQLKIQNGEIKIGNDEI